MRNADCFCGQKDSQGSKAWSAGESTFLISLFSFFLFLFLCASCGGNSGHFRIEGQLKGINQGEFYIYSTDGGARKLDTIQVRNGQFTYQVELDTTATYLLVFPNFSEVPIFGASGAKVTVKGDASHLKQVEIKGTEENERMTAFRLKTSEQMPPEVAKSAAAFIEENPLSLSAAYLLNKFFIQQPEPDYQKAYQLAGTIAKAQPGNLRAEQLVKQLAGLKDLKDKGRLPQFTAIDIDGKRVTNSDLKAKANVITTWSTWNYESQNMQRQLKKLEKDNGVSKLKIVSFCLDASVKDCRKMMERDSIAWSNVCDERMWETPALNSLGLWHVPDNILVDSNGSIIAHSLKMNELKEKIESLMK